MTYLEPVGRVAKFWLSDDSYWRAHSLIWVAFAVVVAYWSIWWSVLLVGLAGLEYGFWLMQTQTAPARRLIPWLGRVPSNDARPSRG
jgi:hypothetical protein